VSNIDTSKLLIDTSAPAQAASENPNGPTVTQLPGGIQRVQFGAAPDPAPIKSDILRGGVSDGSTYRMDAAGNVEQFGGFTRNTTSDDRASATNILDTARSVSGSRHGHVTDAHSVIVPGYGEMSVGAAVRMGFLRRANGGGYEVTGVK